MKFKLNVKKPGFINKRFLLIVSASLIVLLVLGTSVALYQRHQENISQAHAATLATEAKTEQARTSRENLTKAELTTSETYRHQLCDLLAQKAKTKPTAGYVVVPVVACTF